MRDPRIVPPDLRHALRTAVDQLFGSQARLAAAIDVAQGTVSNALGGKPVHREKMERILRALHAQLAANAKELQPAERDAIRAVLNDLDTICHGGRSQKPFLATGAGAMPLTAHNWLDQEQTLKRLVRYGLGEHRALMAIEGPVMSGKSTLAVQLAELARERSFHVAHLDGILFGGTASVSFFEELAITIAEAAGLPHPREGAIQQHTDFYRWFAAARRLRAPPPSSS